MLPRHGFSRHWMVFAVDSVLFRLESVTPDFANMLRALTRTPLKFSNPFRQAPVVTYTSFPIRTMATGKKDNEELKASKLFDVSGFSAVVTGGGTGIGLMISAKTSRTA